MDRDAPEGEAALDGSASRYALLALGVAVVVLLTKLAAWWLTDAVVLLADAMESGLDLVTASLLVFSVRLAASPPDEGHPWGHGKAEYFSAGIQGAFIVAAAIGIGVEAGRRLLEGVVPASLGAGVVLSAFATGLNIALAITMLRAGKRLRSPALVTDGWHNMTDVLNTVGGWLGLLLAWITGWWILDPVVAVLVGVSVLATGLSLLRDAVDGLMDRAIATDELEQLEQALRAVLEGRRARMERLRARRSSNRIFADCVLRVPGELSVAEAHQVCDQLEEAAAAAFPGTTLHIHMEPHQT